MEKKLGKFVWIRKINLTYCCVCSRNVRIYYLFKMSLRTYLIKLKCESKLKFRILFVGWNGLVILGGAVSVRGYIVSMFSALPQCPKFRKFVVMNIDNWNYWNNTFSRSNEVNVTKNCVQNCIKTQTFEASYGVHVKQIILRTVLAMLLHVKQDVSMKFWIFETPVSMEKI